jgi:hypothetical protein
MESLITSYGINFQAFQLTINSLNGLVAGSSALAEYLKQEGIDPGYKPNDIDVFVPGRLEYVRDSRGHIVAAQYVIKSLKTMKDFLASYGFTENDKFGSIDEPNDGYYSSLKKIQKVTSFTNKDGKEIQVIVIDSYNLIEHISKDFDLSACISWWDAPSNTFKTMDPVTTKRKEMYFVRVADTDEVHEKNKMRAEKYVSRGFKLIDKPCPFVDDRDPRDLLSDKKFDDIEVTDIFTLDECSIRDYLQKSDWNIVLKAGEAYYGFQRKALMDYMSSKTVSITRIGKFCETPFNQCISLEGYNQFRYSDYSIYELKSAYSVELYRRPKSLFHLYCYSVKEWVDGSAGGLAEVPPQHLTQPAPTQGPRTIIQPNNTPTVRRIIRRGEPLPPQNVGARAHLEDIIEVGIDDILAAHAHLMVPDNLEAFHAAVREIHGEI